ncbi:MAG: Fur family transcriptional regulator [Phycisphaerales bacterium]
MAGPKSLSGPIPNLDDLAVIEPVCAVFRRTLKGAGLKYTLERAQILDSVMRQPGLFHADELIKGLKEEGFRVSKATVYRTLKLMQDSGIIQRVLFDDDDAGRYQVVFGTSASDLLIRTDNGEAEQIEILELRALCEKLCAERGLRLKGHRLQIFAAPE